MVFSGLFPVDQADLEMLDVAIDKLCINDPSVSVRKDVSPALGSGWRLGFLGMLHMDVFCQRLQQEYDVETIVTSPSVSYVAVRVRMRVGVKVKVKVGVRSITLCFVCYGQA